MMLRTDPGPVILNRWVLTFDADATMTTVAKHALPTFLVFSCLIVLPCRSAAQAVGCDTWVMAAGEQYRAGAFHRLTLGQHYRDLWTTPIEVECL